jgi:2-amino-4-hydroxy-6-hydroxymethyldihydropteridine diphosphokinase
MGGVSKISRTILQLGSNLGNSKVQFMIAQRLIEERIGKITLASSFYTSAAWGFTDQPDFLNQVIEVETILKARIVLEKALEIETEMGRVRNVLFGPRTIDIDILFFNSDIVNMRMLTIPHPLMQQRRFVLAPLAEILPKFVHPILEKNIKQLLKECDDTLNVQKI